MPDALASAFADFYRGRHRAEDALWWLTRPGSPGPSSAEPPQHLFLRAAEELEAAGLVDAAEAMRHAVADLLQSDRRAALDALALAERSLRDDAPVLQDEDRSAGAADGG